MSPEDTHALLAKAGITDAAASDSGRDGAASQTAIVWKLRPDHSIVPVQIGLGLTDHAFTAVTALLAGTLQPGDQVVTGALVSKSQPPAAQGIRR